MQQLPSLSELALRGPHARTVVMPAAIGPSGNKSVAKLHEPPLEDLQKIAEKFRTKGYSDLAEQVDQLRLNASGAQLALSFFAFNKKGIKEDADLQEELNDLYRGMDELETTARNSLRNLPNLLNELVNKLGIMKKWFELNTQEDSE
jgi:hypothetical protein